MKTKPQRLPSWLKVKAPTGNTLWQTKNRLNSLPTVCEEAKCPNRTECFSKNTATFLALGSACTRSCSFCDIDFAKNPLPLSEKEPQEIADSALQLGLKHVVITMVARDDLEDGGALQIKKIVQTLRATIEDVTVELLTSDFQGDAASFAQIIEADPEIFNHNIETVVGLSDRVRHKATYERSLDCLEYMKTHLKHRLIKSGLMLGLGETLEEVKQSLKDLYEVGCDIVTLGQYLQPSAKKRRVSDYIPPERFEELALFGKQLGIPYVYSGPFVRSSYNAKEIFDKLRHG